MRGKELRIWSVTIHSMGVVGSDVGSKLRNNTKIEKL